MMIIKILLIVGVFAAIILVAMWEQASYESIDDGGEPFYAKEVSEAEREARIKRLSADHEYSEKLLKDVEIEFVEVGGETILHVRNRTEFGICALYIQAISPDRTEYFVFEDVKSGDGESRIVRTEPWMVGYVSGIWEWQ